MNIENNRASSKLLHENAYTNNTFNLTETEKTIRCTLENSFNYLKNLQKSYINISRFNKTEEDIFFDIKNRPSISLDKDFLEFSARKDYRMSKFYNKYLDITTISENRNIFSFLPIIMIDDCVTFSYIIKPSLDGHTDIIFTGISDIKNFIKNHHRISITFLKNTYFHQFTANKYIIDKYNWSIPTYITNINLELISDAIFIFVRDLSNKYGSNYFIANIDSSGNLTLNKDDVTLYDLIMNYKDIEFTIISPENMIELSGTRQIFNRIDNGARSSTFVLERGEWDHYNMPIPVNNIFLFKKEKNTGKLTYENNKEIILHYPNIYEIISTDIDSDMYEYKIYYFYRNLQEFLGYENSLKYIYRYFSRKLNCDYETTIVTLLYQQYEDSTLQNYFFKFFNHTDAEYDYSHNDFFSTLKPYDFDYKTEKMKEFLEKNPNSFIPYAKKVGTPYQSYHLYVKNIDLEKRLRMDTCQEADCENNYFYFEEPFYVFMFANEGRTNLNLRFFIDGIFTDSVFQLHIGNIDYLYIPQKCITEDSYIFIERFETYTYREKIRFTDVEMPFTLTFDSKEFIKPTLFDLFVVDENLKRLDRKKFKMYALVNKSEYDVSDCMDNDDDITNLLLKTDMLYEDPDTGELYILLEDDEDDATEDPLVVDLNNEADISYTNERLPLKYMTLTKLKIFCKDVNYLNRNLSFIINKTPFLSINDITKKGLPKIKFFCGDIPWNKEPSFIRTFVNGRFQPMGFEIISPSTKECQIAPKCYLYPGDVLSIDLTPYSYDLELYIEEIPENFMIRLNNSLKKPFDLSYHDVYLNGRKLCDHNIKMITPDVIQLFNVSSRKNLRIYRRDRDYEYYGFTSIINVPLDEILNSEDIPEQDKNDIILDIIYSDIPKEDVRPGEDTESDNENLEVVPDNIFQIYRFYLDVILAQSIARPNNMLIDRQLVQECYEEVWKLYTNADTGRLVIRPNIGHSEATTVLMIGSPYDSNFIMSNPKIIINNIKNILGDTSPLAKLSDGTVLGSLTDLFKKIGRFTFKLNDDDTLTIDFISDDETML